MKKTTPIAELIAVLMPEGFQTEESAASHCSREAERLGTVGPAAAMRNVSEHAKRALPRLGELAKARGLGGAPAATVVGHTFSNVRTFFADLVVSQEKSYRGTLLGIQHGVGFFHLLEDAAVASGDQELADFCAQWVTERTELAAEVERELAWFAQNPEAALARAVPAFVKSIGRSLPFRGAKRADANAPEARA